MCRLIAIFKGNDQSITRIEFIYLNCCKLVFLFLTYYFSFIRRGEYCEIASKCRVTVSGEIEAQYGSGYCSYVMFRVWGKWNGNEASLLIDIFTSCLYSAKDILNFKTVSLLSIVSGLPILLNLISPFRAECPNHIIS